MSFLKKMLNPLENLKTVKKSVKSLAKGDLMGGLDPENLLIPKMPGATPQTGVRQGTPYMGAQGQTLRLGGGPSPGGQQYAPNQFATMQQGQQPSNAMMFRPAMGGPNAGMAGTGLVNPQQNPLQQQAQFAQANALRNPSAGNLIRNAMAQQRVR